MRYGYRHTIPETPHFLNDVSEESLTRIERILDALFFSFEKLGGKVNNDFTMSMNNDSVSVSLTEGKNKLIHELTKSEAAELVRYEDEKRNGHYASKPKINKYDYPYNGKLTIKIDYQSFKDTEKIKLEDMLDKMLIAVFESLESERKSREAREKAERLRQEEERKKEEIRQRKNLEIEKVKELVNESEDYVISNQIRQYIQAVINNGNLNEDTIEWANWAKEKADWFDPSIRREDEYLGVRNHKDSSEKKDLKPTGYSYYRW
jgi:hypothetical protein